MISLPIDVRTDFKDKVKNFCLINNIEWGVVYSESWLNGVTGTPNEVEIVRIYIKDLEGKRKQYRRSKSFWWKLWH